MEQQRVRSPLSFARVLGYASGAMGYQILDRVVVAALLYFYIPPDDKKAVVYISAKAFGAIFIFGRVLDSISDPLVSYLSDRSRSQHGRRRPFMLYGGPPMILSAILLFYPPVKGLSLINTAYLAALLGVFFVSFTVYVCPYLALQPEMTVTQRDRINLTTYKGLFMLFGSIIGTVFWAPLAEAFGFQTMAIMFGAAAAALLFLPVAAVDEKRHCVSQPCGADLMTSLLSTLKNRPFVVYLVGNITFWFGFNIISSAATYYVTVLLGLPLSSLMYYLGVVFGVTILCIPLVNMACKAMGKRRVMIGLLGMFVVLFPMVYFMNAGWLPISKYTFGFILMGLIGAPLAGLFVVPDAIVSDLTDYDEMLTGERREAMYFGAQGFFLKVNMGVSTYLMTWMFDAFGRSAAHPLGVQLTGPVSAVFALIGMLAFVFFYPGDIEKKVEQFRIEKEKAA